MLGSEYNARENLQNTVKISSSVSLFAMTVTFENRVVVREDNSEGVAVVRDRSVQYNNT